MFSNRKIILITILLVVLCVAAYVLLVIIPRRIAEQSYDGARKLGQDLERAFQFTPEITVNNTIVIQQKTDIVELATLSQKFHHTYHWTNTRLYSTKKIEVSGTFDAKFGFDLQEKLNIVISDNKAVITFPDAKLLSIEVMGDIMFNDENGMWNWVNQEDRSRAVNAFVGDARNYAKQSPFIEDARSAMREKLTAMMKPYVDEVEIRIGSTTVDKELKVDNAE